MHYARELGFRLPLCRGDDVRAVQQALTILQTHPPCGTVDGIYGAATRDSVMDFQHGRNLDPDGVVGPLTWTALFDAAGTQVQDPAAPASPAKLAVQGLAASPQDALPSGPVPADMPLRRASALKAWRWLQANFGPQIEAATRGTPFDPMLVGAIALKETGNIWLSWTTAIAPATVLARCVFDASGDYPGTSRSAFPRNAAAMRAKYGDAFTNLLIAEANETRKLRGYTPQTWLYKGYGIFQYDLQHVDTDRAFFEQRQWASFDECVQRCVRELSAKYAAAKQDLREAVKGYNGSGAKAEQYRDHVLYLFEWLKAG